jgi:hypothetical protein
VFQRGEFARTVPRRSRRAIFPLGNRAPRLSCAELGTQPAPSQAEGGAGKGVEESVDIVSTRVSIRGQGVRVADERPAKVRLLTKENIMGKVVVVENVTLDGVMQAPGGADEDAREVSRMAAGLIRMPTRSWPRRWARA